MAFDDNRKFAYIYTYIYHDEKGHLEHDKIPHYGLKCTL